MAVKAPFRGFGGENPVNIVAIPEYANPPLTAGCEYFLKPHFNFKFSLPIRSSCNLFIPYSHIVQ